MTPLVLFLMIVAAVTASAQTARHGPVTDKEKIADALRAGPTFSTKDATRLDWLIRMTDARLALMAQTACRT